MTEIIAPGRYAKNALLNLSLLLLTLLVLTIGSEMFLRLFRPQIFPEKVPARWYVKHPMLGFFQARNFQGEMKTREFKIHFKTNSMGFRDNEVAWNDPGIFRILILGDSFVWGMGADQEENYPAVLERIMNQSGANLRFEVINAGVCRYYTHLERLLFESIVDTLKPKLVLLNVLPNDVWDAVAGLDAVTVSKDGYLVKKGKQNSRIKRVGSLRIPRPFSFRGLLKLNSHLYVLIDNRIARFGAKKLAQHEESAGKDKYDKALRSILNEINRIYIECSKKNVKLAVIIIPQRERFSHDSTSEFFDKFEREIEGLCSKENVPFLNSYSVLREAAEKEPLYWKFDGHLSPRGYALLARGVYGFISAGQLIPSERR